MKQDMPYRTPVWRLAIAGVVAGSALYFFPFLVPALAFVFLVALFFRLIGGGPWHARRMHMRHMWAAKWHAMSEEQREAFRHRYHHGCRPWDTPAEDRATTNGPTPA